MSPFVFRTYVLQVKHLVRYGDPVGPLENLWSMICAVESSSFMQSIVKGMTWHLDYTGMKHRWFIFLFFFVLDLYLYANVKCLFKILKRWTVYIWGIGFFLDSGGLRQVKWHPSFLLRQCSWGGLAQKYFSLQMNLVGSRYSGCSNGLHNLSSFQRPCMSPLWEEFCSSDLQSFITYVCVF